MDVKEAILTRRAYRSLIPVDITEDIMRELAEAAQLAPSCFNNQPWRYIFVHDPAALETMKPAFKQGNEWCYADSMIIVVLSKPDLDCRMKDGRDYYLFDVGMSVGLLLLRATELGLVAHPIAGYSPEKTREVLGIPEEWNVVTLINVGKHTTELSPVLDEQQRIDEGRRPPRIPIEQFIHHNRYEQGKSETKPAR